MHRVSAREHVKLILEDRLVADGASLSRINGSLVLAPTLLRLLQLVNVRILTLNGNFERI